MQKLKLKKEYQKYPEYKISGIDWIGKIPKEWGFRKVKYIGKTVAGGTPSTNEPKFWENGNISWLPSGAVQNCIVNNKKAKYITRLALKNSATKMIKPNSVLVALTGATCANVGFLPFESTANQSVVAVHNYDNTLAKYLYYAFLSNRKQFLVYKNGGAQSGINENNVKNIFISFPPKQEQQKIADFLDEKVELIDEIVKKKKKLIELLKEKRTAIINQAINVGSYNNLQRLKFSVKINPSKQRIKSFPGNHIVSFLPMEKVSSKGKVNLDQEQKLENVREGFTYFKNKDVIFAKITPCFENGKGALVENLKNEIGFGSTEFIVLRTNIDMDPKYIYYLVSSHKFRKIGEVEMRGSAGQKRVPESFVRNFLLHKITIEAQKEIIKDIDKKVNDVDNITKKILESINLLNEFKSSLISNAVTGKVKI